MGTQPISDAHVGRHSTAGLPPIDFDEFHRYELPRRLREGANAQVHWDVRGAAPIAIRLAGSDSAYSYVCDTSAVRVERGVVADAEVVLEIPGGPWQDYVYEMRTRFGLLYSGAVRFVSGTFERWDDWEPAIRCLYSARPIYDPKTVRFIDRDGSPLDLRRRFSLDDSLEDMRHFLRATGWLVVERACLDSLGELSEEIDRLTGQAREGELWSWWASDQHGRRFPYRLLYSGLRSARIAALDDDPTIGRLARLAGDDLVPIRDRIEGHLAVLKPFGADAVVDNLANLPWHKDCGLGGCPLSCPAVNVGIQLDAANAQSSQLLMMAGSWGKVCHDRPTQGQLAGMPVVALDTEPGDVTMHITCGLHAGPPPTGPNPRRTLYLPFYAARIKDILEPMQGFQQLIPNWGSGVVLNEGELRQKFY